jgi:hypothetical protein
MWGKLFCNYRLGKINRVFFIVVASWLLKPTYSNSYNGRGENIAGTVEWKMEVVMHFVYGGFRIMGVAPHHHSYG